MLSFFFGNPFLVCFLRLHTHTPCDMGHFRLRERVRSMGGGRHTPGMRPTSGQHAVDSSGESPVAPTLKRSKMPKTFTAACSISLGYSRLDATHMPPLIAELRAVAERYRAEQAQKGWDVAALFGTPGVTKK